MIVNTINKDLVYVSDVCRVFFVTETAENGEILKKA